MGYPILYILMRTDMDSMNPGKGMAQAAHAANQFVATQAAHPHTFDHMAACKEWAHYNGYGTTVVLSVDSESDLRNAVNGARDEGFDAGLTTDPTYPVRDGAVTHLIAIPTCGYVFVPNRDAARPHLVSKLRLHP